MTKINFDGGLPVVSTQRKLAIRVTANRRAFFPGGAVLSPYGQDNANPTLCVHNATDTKDGPEGTWQGAAPGDLILMNAVDPEVASCLLDLVDSGVSDAIIMRAAKLMGQMDVYTAPASFYTDYLVPAGRSSVARTQTGVVARSDRDVALVVRSPRGVIWRKLGDSVNHIDSFEILARDYRCANGLSIKVGDIPLAE